MECHRWSPWGKRLTQEITLWISVTQTKIIHTAIKRVGKNNIIPHQKGFSDTYRFGL